MRTRTFLVPLLAAALSGCVFPKPWAPSPPELDPAAPGMRVEVREARARPTLTVLAREGDPSAAVALAVLTDGGPSSATALGAIVESRLEQAGFRFVDSEASRDGYRLTALLPDRGLAAPFVATLRDALLTPLSPGSPELAFARDRLAALPRQPISDPALDPLARCSGEPTLLADDARLDLATPQGLAQLEGLRRASHLASRLSLGVVGPRQVGDEVTEALASTSRWPDGAWPKDADLRGTADWEASLAKGETSRVKLALRVGDAAVAKAVAERAGDPAGLLATRLASLGSGWRMAEVSATARARGGCVSLTAEPTTPLPDSLAEAMAARAASILLTELREELEEAARFSGARDPWRAAIDASDPREAASLAAFWSLSTRGRDREPSARTSIVAELPSSAMEAKGSEPGSADSRFTTNLKALVEAPRDLTLLPKLRVERGQNRLWLLVASPCGLSAESSSDAGLTALAMFSAAAGGERNGVVLEPWVSAEGAGLLAHAAPDPSESPSDLATRVAREAARALAASTHAPAGFARARAILLSKVASRGPAFETAAEALAPGRPSQLLPLGTWSALPRLGAEAAALRAHALISGPLDMAILADYDAQQGETAARILERWLSRGTARPRSCPLPSPHPEPSPGLVEVELPQTAVSARAILAFPLSGPAQRERAAWLVSGFEGKEGFLAQSLRSLGKVTATARLQGGKLASALVIELRAPDEDLDDAVAQLRALMQRLSSGAITTEDLARALRHRNESSLQASLDPRRRIVDLFLDRQFPAPPKLEDLQAFAKEALRDDKAILVLARPRKN